MTVSTEFVESLAADIGSQIYIDVAKWHLYLNDAKLHFPLAEKLCELLEDDRLNEANVQAVLKGFVVEMAGGRTKVPLSDLVPLQCQMDLMDLLEEKQQEL